MNVWIWNGAISSKTNVMILILKLLIFLFRRWYSLVALGLRIHIWAYSFCKGSSHLNQRNKFLSPKLLTQGYLNVFRCCGSNILINEINDTQLNNYTINLSTAELWLINKYRIRNKYTQLRLINASSHAIRVLDAYLNSEATVISLCSCAIWSGSSLVGGYHNDVRYTGEKSKVRTLRKHTYIILTPLNPTFI